MARIIRKTSIFITIVFLAAMLSHCSKQNSENNWNQTVQQISSGVVSIQTDIPFSFDGSWNKSGYATGFIVDATNGIILTNRHVVSPGPVTAKAILINNEEIDLSPLYFDPVHDFGFFKYDPKQIKHIQPHEFTLSDTLPNVGEAIRIVGNDAGQKISILDGTISRIDRDAPQYGKGRYNDFNIYYIQAATSSTGGSSGSPVINIKGEVVALNAGSQSESANAFYLPLATIKQALKKLRQNQPILRGTLQSTFNFTPFAELTRLGLTAEIESTIRNKYPNLKGLLVLRQVIPETPADDKLKVGDILLQINQVDIVDFSSLEAVLNAHVTQQVEVKILRQGEEYTHSVVVNDLHPLSPQSIVKFDGSIFHTLSYQQARHFNKPIKGAYVASSASYFRDAGLPSKSVITEFNGAKIETVEQLNEQLVTIEEGKKINLRYFGLSNPSTSNYALVEINRKWFEHSYCYQSAELSYWPCEKYSKPTIADKNDVEVNQEQISDSGNIEDALVRVSFTSPYSIQGRSGSNSKTGTGVIVDINKGWVVVPRSVVFSNLGDAKIVLNNRYEIEGNVEYVHPLHNLALVSFNPSEIAQARLSQINFVDKKLERGEPIVQMGLNYDGNVEYRETYADVTEEIWLRQYSVPRFVDKNIEVTYFVNPNTAIEGIIFNTAGEAVSLWAIFDNSDTKGKSDDVVIAGYPASYIIDLLSVASSNEPVYSLDINLTMLPPVNALQMGLDEQWLDKINQTNKQSNKVLGVYNVSYSSNSHEYLKHGDLLLAINGEPVSTFKQVEELTQAPEVEVTFFSEGEVLTKTVKTTPLNGTNIERVLYWSGLYLHAPHRAALLQGNISANGVYVSSYRYGSPASRYKLYAMQRIVEIDGNKTDTIDDFINAVKGKPHQSSVLIKTLDFNNKPKVITLKVNNHYWPFYELRNLNGEWQKIDHSSEN